MTGHEGQQDEGASTARKPKVFEKCTKEWNAVLPRSGRLPVGAAVLWLFLSVSCCLPVVIFVWQPELEINAAEPV